MQLQLQFKEYCIMCYVGLVSRMNANERMCKCAVVMFFFVDFVYYSRSCVVSGC